MADDTAVLRAYETLTRVAGVENDLAAHREHRELHGDDGWQLPAERNNIERRSAPRLVTKTRDDGLVETPQPPQLVTRDVLQATVDGLVARSFVDEVVDETIGALTQHRDVIEKQGDDVNALRAEIATLRGQLAELTDIVQGLAADFASLADDVIDRGGNTNITTLKTGTSR